MGLGGLFCLFCGLFWWGFVDACDVFGYCGGFDLMVVGFYSVTYIWLSLDI